MLDEVIERKLLLLKAEEALLGKLMAVPEASRKIRDQKEITVVGRRIAKMKAEVEDLMVRLETGSRGDADAAGG